MGGTWRAHVRPSPNGQSVTGYLLIVITPWLFARAQSFPQTGTQLRDHAPVFGCLEQ